MIDEKFLVELFLNLVRINGESGNEKEPADFIKAKLNDLGISYREDTAGEIFGGSQGNILGYYPGTLDSVPPILFSSHMDTIEPTSGISTKIEDGIIRSSGNTILGADDRAGVAIVLTVLETIIKNKITTGPIYLAFTVAEEIGMYGAKNLTDIDPELKTGFVFDSSALPGKIITTAPASSTFYIKVIGKAAHAAVQPEEGINAIKIAADAISKIDSGRISPESTANFGMIQGGKAVNIVPDEIIIEGEVRSTDSKQLKDKFDEIKSIFNSSALNYGGKIEMEINNKYPSFKLTANSPVVEIAQNAIRAVGLEPENIIYPGGSDANVYNNHGIETVNLGLGYRNVHSHSEYMEISKLKSAADIGLEIARRAAEYFTNNED